MDVSALTSGMYIIRFETDENIINERFIISK
ncbi:MAG: T9SS type A sorting domain-containing protein [Bacteroidetes bacterium]|nr:T9SS type A sorting domain-containing protein [Bacteroidota bacterium]